jgi:hypothetical protein
VECSSWRRRKRQKEEKEGLESNAISSNASQTKTSFYGHETGSYNALIFWRILKA